MDRKVINWRANLTLMLLRQSQAFCVIQSYSNIYAQNVKLLLPARMEQSLRITYIQLAKLLRFTNVLFRQYKSSKSNGVRVVMYGGCYTPGCACVWQGSGTFDLLGMPLYSFHTFLVFDNHRFAPGDHDLTSDKHMCIFEKKNRNSL